jgi:hypothetical protein
MLLTLVCVFFHHTCIDELIAFMYICNFLQFDQFVHFKMRGSFFMSMAVFLLHHEMDEWNMNDSNIDRFRLDMIL